MSTYLVNSVLIDSFLLVETGKSTIVTFVESPSLSDRDPELVGFFKRKEKSLDSTLQTRSVSSVELKTFSFDELTTISGFFDT